MSVPREWSGFGARRPGRVLASIPIPVRWERLIRELFPRRQPAVAVKFIKIKWLQRRINQPAVSFDKVTVGILVMFGLLSRRDFLCKTLSIKCLVYQTQLLLLDQALQVLGLYTMAGSAWKKSTMENQRPSLVSRTWKLERHSPSQPAEAVMLAPAEDGHGRIVVFPSSKVECSNITVMVLRLLQAQECSTFF